MWEENFGTRAGVHLIWGPLKTGFTVLASEMQRTNQEHCEQKLKLISQGGNCFIYMYTSN